jgi:hypothetical protein
MIQSPKSSTVYANDLLAALVATGISQTSPGGKARAITDTLSDQMSALELQQFSNLAQVLLPYATGDTLDFLGAPYNVIRLQRQDATVAETDNNFQFYVRFGNFGSINNGNDITVPAGTKLYTSDGENGVVYLTQYDVFLPAAQTTVSFGAVSAVPGAAGQAAANVFNSSSFSGYADSRYGTLLVTNNFGIITGCDAETDDNYRYRISLQMQSTGGCRADDIRAAVLTVVGLQDVVFERKAGTFFAYVYGISPAVPDSLVQAVQTAINLAVAFPLNGLAIVPDLVGFSLSTPVTMAPGVTAVDVPNILSAAASAAQTYINNLAIGSPLVINQVADQILNSDPRILDIGDPDKPIAEFYIWRSRQDGTRYSRFLVNDYTPALGERIVTENIANAIALTQA